MLVVMCFLDPGYLKKNPKDTMYKLTSKYDAGYICAECMVHRIPRSRHCQCCNRCV